MEPDLTVSPQHEIALPYGTLTVRVDRADWDLNRLCGFASRQNPKRPFLIVSKILGKHIPADPYQLVHASDQLIRSFPELPAPICVLGMAETAVSFSQTMFERMSGIVGVRDVGYTQTTRYQLSQPLSFQLEESHSHATRHRVYVPAASECRRQFQNTRTLVVVDDEMTTGNTTANLVDAFCKNVIPPERVAIVCLTNWMSKIDRESIANRIRSVGVMDVTFHALLDGELVYQPLVQCPAADGRAVGTRSSHSEFLPLDSGRLGLCRPVEYDFASMIADIKIPSRVAVIGTGEFMYPPSLLARWLADRGHEVTIQSSTRSPVSMGGCIGSVIRTRDNYHDGIDNFLYNPPPSDRPDSITLVCYETDPLPADHDLVEQLGGNPLLPNRFLKA